MPIKPKRVFFTPYTPDVDVICLAQQAAGAGSLLLNGAAVVHGVASFGTAETEYQEVGYQLCLVSTGNLSGVNFTVTGTDAEGNALSEIIAGPNNNTVETTGYFKTVTSITVDGAVGTNVTIGTVDEFVTKPIPVDIYCDMTTLDVDVSGTINYTSQFCYQRPTAGETPVWGDSIAAGAVDASYIHEGCIGAVRLLGNSFTAGATIALLIRQPRYN